MTDKADVTADGSAADIDIYWIPAQVCVQIRDGGRWLLIYHNGDHSEPVGRNRSTGVIRFSDGPQWRIATSLTATPNVEEITGV